MPVSSDLAVPAGLVCPRWALVSVPGGVRRADFRDGCSPDDLAGDSEADGSPSCRDNLAGWPTQSVVRDNSCAADDKDSAPNRPNSRDCNRRVALPSSIPIRPIPKGGS